ncbi:MAG: hypothetical protein FJW46_07005 [Actinobacteria bacterium]|nr:hypothetical protein [Actinomycetota bacterium]
MTRFETLRNIFVCNRGRRLKLLFSLFLLLALLPLAPSYALDRRVIDVVSVSWPGSRALPGTINEVRNQIDTVVSPWWRNLTTIEGDSQDRKIEFYSGESLAAPIATNVRMPCQGNYVTWTSAIRVETYKRLGITNWENRYLVIVTPDAGCIWSGRALIGDVKKPGGVIVSHNSIDGFIIAHELGHSLGLGHSNLIRCNNGSADGPWSSCKAIEYGGAIDLMSNVNNQSPLSTYHQWRMGLLDSKDIYQSWKSESVEINPVDVYGKPRAIFLRDGSTTYWIEYRKEGSGNGAGLVIYRTDPPPASSVQSPNEGDFGADLSEAIGTDIWMMNLDSFSYASSKASGSMALAPGKSTTLYSGNVSISASVTGTNSALVKIERKESSSLRFKPILTSATTWRSPDTQVLDDSYANSVGGVSEYEIRINGEGRKVVASEIGSWQPTYLNPFTAPQILKVRDLPEGEYDLTLRVRDLAGSWSPWSDAMKVNIDRAYPLAGGTVKLTDYRVASVGVELSDFRDEGSGLCSTELVNPEGWILSKSKAKSKPVMEFSLGSANAKLQTFDCLGNGRRAEVASKISIIPTNKLKRSGKLSAASNLPQGSMRCTGTCTLYATTRGFVAPIVASGSVDMTIKGATVAKIEANRRGERLDLVGRDAGARLTSVKISGKNFTLIGVASAEISISKFVDTERPVRLVDNSLDDAAQKALDKYGFTAEDFTAEWGVFPMGRGTTLEDPTLDLCSSEFPSELDRKERRQIAVSKSGNPYLFLSSETVRYKNSAAGEKALAEVKKSYTNCVKSAGGVERDGSFTKYEFFSIPENLTRLVPEANRVVVHAKIGESAAARYLFGIYQYKGEMFTGLYVVRSGDSAFPEDELLRWVGVAEKFAERLNS